MHRHLCTFATLMLSSGLALGQQTQPVQQHPEPAAPATHDEHGHLSKKEKKELKKEHERERKDEEHRLKKEAEEQKKADKEREKELAKERKHERDHDRKKEEKEVAKEQRDERQPEEKEVSRERHETGESHPSMVGRAAGAGVSVVTAPFRLARSAAPSLLHAQRNVSHAIYSAFPTSNVAVLLTDAGQIVLRGAAPSPSVRSSLLQLAMTAAGGYPIVDQLAADFVGDAASAAASAAVGGVSTLIHGNGSSADETPAESQYADASTAPADSSAVAALEPGTSACVNVSNAQVLLTGQAQSQGGADLIRQFARQVGGPSAALNDQLTAAGSTSSTPSQSASPASPTSNLAPASAAVTPGSSVCVNVRSAGEVLLSGTVASAREMTAVEQAAQPLVASARLNDQLTTGSVGAAQSASSPSTATGPTADENRLAQTLHAIPRLSNVDASVSSGAIRLSGTVDTSQDDQMARDIARQHAPGLSVVDQIAIAGRTPQP